MHESDLEFLNECIELTASSEIDERISALDEIDNIDEMWSVVQRSLKLYQWISSSLDHIYPLDQALAVCEQIDGGMYFVDCELGHESRIMSVVGYGSSNLDPRFLNVETDATWFTIAYRCAHDAKDQIRDLVQHARTRYEAIVTAHAFTQQGPIAESESAVTAVGALDLAFEPVRKHLISEPAEVLEIIRTNRGTIRMSKLSKLEAAILLEPLKVHFDLSQHIAGRIKADIVDQTVTKWFGASGSLRSNLKTARSNRTERPTYEALAAAFAIALSKYKIRQL